MCPLCKRHCRSEELDDATVCGLTGFAYGYDASGALVICETNRTSAPPDPPKRKVTWTISDAARVKTA